MTSYERTQHVEEHHPSLLPGRDEDVAAMVACAAVLHPGRPLVGYAHGDELGRWVAAGFRATGTHVVWVR